MDNYAKSPIFTCTCSMGIYLNMQQLFIPTANIMVNVSYNIQDFGFVFNISMAKKNPNV